MIRRATVAEAPAVAALVRRAYARWIEVIGRRPAPMDEDYGPACAAGAVVVLECDGAMGAVMVMTLAEDHLWIDNIAVDADRQGRGLGRDLIAFAEAEARRLGLPELRLCTNRKMLANLGLYARLGFVETEHRVVDGFDRVFMAKHLS